MTQYLPTNGFKWLTEVQKLVNMIPRDNPDRRILKVDLEFPE